MKKNVTNLTQKQLRAVIALTTNADVTKAASVAGVSRETIYRWLRNPCFKTALESAISDALNNLSRKLVALGDKAADALDLTLTDQSASASSRVAAANIILSRLLELRSQYDLEQRLTRLEKTYENDKRG